jgi:hypothetical protein
MAGVSMTDVFADDLSTLVVCCAEATLRHVDGSVDELGQAGALLADAMSVLRENFAAALSAETNTSDRGECRRNLEMAMVALQCEDALIQMLENVRQHTLQTADVLRYVLAPINLEPDSVMVHRTDRTACEAMASRLRLAVIALDSGIARSGPVKQKEAVAGTVDLF